MLVWFDKWNTRIVVAALAPLILLVIHARLDRPKARVDHEHFIKLWKEIWSEDNWR